MTSSATSSLGAARTVAALCLPLRLVADGARFYVARERADRLLMLDVELLCVKPVGNPPLSLLCGRTVAQAGTGRDEVVFEFLSHFAEHVRDYSPL